MACKTLEEICECVSPAPDGSCYSPGPREFSNWAIRLLCAIRAGGGGGGGGGIVTESVCRIASSATTWSSPGDVISITYAYNATVEPPTLLSTLIFNETTGLVVDETAATVLADSTACAAVPTGESCEDPVHTVTCAEPIANGALVSSEVTGVASIAAGFWSVSVHNTGMAAGLVDGQSIPAGATANFAGYTHHNGASVASRFLPAISLDGTGTTLIVRTFV